MWTPTDTQSVWLAATRAVRTPSDVEDDFNLTGYVGTAQNGLPFFARFEANPNFRSEILYGYEMGYRGLMGKNVYLDLAGFYNQYYDLFSEGDNRPDIRGDQPATDACSASSPVPQRAVGFDDRWRNRTGVETDELLAASRLVFIPSYGTQKEFTFAGRGHCSGN